MAYSRILVALAGQQDERNVVERAVELGRLAQAPLHVLHVNDPHAAKVSMMMDAESYKSEDDLRRLFLSFGYEHEVDNVEFEVVTAASVPKTIADATKTGDLLVIGHRQKNRFLSAFADTADKHLSDIVACPVLLVPRDHRG